MSVTRDVDFTALVAALADADPAARRIVAVAGPPGAGKSTFAERLREALDAPAPGRAALLAMDGFHYDDRVLEARGDRPRKGAPHTFDIDGLGAMLARLKADDGREIAVPVFDRSIEIARAGAAIIPAGARIVVVEGNYLLLDDPAWAPLRAFFDLTVMLQVPRAVLVERLSARWQGYGMSEAAIVEKLDGNDLPNVDRVLTGCVAADFRVENV
ncbi:MULTISPECIES: nucleoside/nucleotide kinase family protein [Burkholderia]|uniref:nucleoside/nucleotide kinase family protein n=1 Tax=Burkholderia TaxID=32008 RepID=UPI00050F2716|nr:MULTISPECIES: nucleoside/nucleotide kinase family protein [Burkholderia]AYQ91052.1 nucleoside/nucleotide kinase family protein [Burkholderia gladioli]KGE07911.1 nucleoside triphosphate hydrolase [Burkholderia gladioli]KVM61085.1 nucleoside triphosphate hydrolase [Burkholderia gladioli]NBI49297.1 nucleoside/nucleotide kinase family protein [Burkholderia sp. ISTR5]